MDKVIKKYRSFCDILSAMYDPWKYGESLIMYGKAVPKPHQVFKVYSLWSIE